MSFLVNNNFFVFLRGLTLCKMRMCGAGEGEVSSGGRGSGGTSRKQAGTIAAFIY